MAAIMMVWTESLQHFLRADSWIRDSSKDGNMKTKGLRTSPPKRVSALYYTFESVHDGDHDGVVRIFVGLFCELGGLLIIHSHYVAQFSSYWECEIDYMAQFFPFQECNL